MKLLPLTLALLALPLAARAQDAPEVAEPPVATPPVTVPTAVVDVPAKEAGQVVFDADKSLFDDPKGIGLYTGDVTATQQGEDFILYAQQAVSARKGTTTTATATKDLRVETRESTIRARKLFANFDTKVFSMTEDVVVSSYGENDGVAPDVAATRRAEKKRRPVRIACDRLDWNYDTRQATLVGNIRIVQEDSVGTCNQIIYDEPANAARLIGNVKFVNEKRQQFLTDELLLFIDTGLVKVDTPVRVTGAVTNVADPAKPATPKPVIEFPQPVGIGDIELPQPPPDIDKFLPRPGEKPVKTPEKPAKKNAEKVPAQEPKTPEPKAAEE